MLTDTLPASVTYVSGGTYNSANRVVSFPVTLGAGQSQDYSFTVQVNNGTYFPAEGVDTLLNEKLTGTAGTIGYFRRLGGNFYHYQRLDDTQYQEFQCAKFILYP
ncbi:MAG: hypothetical protein U0T56_02240 [Ferruginibacter sp.]